MGEKILICIMGGKISTTKENQGYIGGFQDIPEYLRNYHEEKYRNLEFLYVSIKDAEKITDKDTANLWQAIKDSKNRYFIVTHDLEIMEKTARYIKKCIKSDSTIETKRKNILFTGSEEYLEDYLADNPATQNLEYSLNNVEDLDPGVYLYTGDQILVIQ